MIYQFDSIFVMDIQYFRMLISLWYSIPSEAVKIRLDKNEWGKRTKKLVTLTKFYICNSDAYRNRKAHMPNINDKRYPFKRKDGRTER